MPRIARPGTLILPALASRGCLAVLLSAGCSSAPDGDATGTQSDTGDTSATGGEPEMREPEGTSVYIKILSKGTPVARASVTVHSQRYDDPDDPDDQPPPAPVYTTDGAGNLLIENLSAGAFVAQVDAPGHAAASVVLDLKDGMHAGTRVHLLALAEPIVFDAALGGRFEQDGVRVQMPANAVVDADNKPVTGPVQITITPFDPSKRLSETPWPLRGQRTADNGGEGVILKTFYMADISLWRGSEHLQLAPDKTAAVEFLLPTNYGEQNLAAVATVGDEIPSWYYDYEAGTWKEEGAGRVVPSSLEPGRLAWTTDLTHFSPHNCDEPIPPDQQTCVLVTVHDAEDNPVPDVNVVLQCFQYTTQGHTNADGQVRLITQADDPVGVWVGSPDTPLTDEIIIKPGNPGAVCPMDLDDAGACYELGILYDDPKSDDCSPGSEYPCPYSGDPKDEDIGICHAGHIVCDDLHQWSDSCEGEVTPLDHELCTKDVDEDCDGKPIDPMVICECDPMIDLPIPCFDGNGPIQGICTAGLQTCDGGMWTACEGGVDPEPQENCATELDENCDGNPMCGYGVAGWPFGDAADQRAIDVAVTANHIFVLGRFVGTFQVGPDMVSSAAEHAYLASFDPNGLGEHIRDLGAVWPGDLNLAANALNEVVVAGTLDGVFNLDGCQLMSDGLDFGILRFASDLSCTTASQKFTLAGQQRASAVSLDDLGNVFFAGLYGSDTDINIDGSVLPQTPPNERDVVAIRVDPLDIVQWIRPLPARLPPADTRAPDLAASASAVLLAGAFQGSHDFGPETLFSDGNSDLFAARLDPTTGFVVWAKDFGNMSDEPGYVSVALGSDSFALTGVIHDTVSFGLGAQHTVGVANSPSVFLHRRSLVNEPLWTTHRGLATPQALDGGHAVAVDEEGRTVLVGTASGDPELYTAKFSVDGQPYWEFTHPNGGDQFGAAVTLRPDGYPIVVGRSNSPFTVINGLQIANNGGMDPFVVLLQL